MTEIAINTDLFKQHLNFTEFFYIYIILEIPYSTEYKQQSFESSSYARSFLQSSFVNLLRNRAFLSCIRWSRRFQPTLATTSQPVENVPLITPQPNPLYQD